MENRTWNSSLVDEFIEKPQKPFLCMEFGNITEPQNSLIKISECQNSSFCEPGQSNFWQNATLEISFSSAPNRFQKIGNFALNFDSKIENFIDLRLNEAENGVFYDFGGAKFSKIRPRLDSRDLFVQNIGISNKARREIVFRKSPTDLLSRFGGLCFLLYTIFSVILEPISKFHFLVQASSKLYWLKSAQPTLSFEGGERTPSTTKKSKFKGIKQHEQPPAYLRPSYKKEPKIEEKPPVQKKKKIKKKIEKKEEPGCCDFLF